MSQRLGSARQRYAERTIPFRGTLPFYCLSHSACSATPGASCLWVYARLDVADGHALTYTYIHTRDGAAREIGSARHAPPQVLRWPRDCAVALTVIGDMAS